MAESSRFTHKNPGFTCASCQFLVPPAAKGCRNHCPRCLTSKHVDIYPGDRANRCLGLLRAVSYEIDSKKGIILNFVCTRCGAKTRNKATLTGPEPDNYDVILALNQRIL